MPRFKITYETRSEWNDKMCVKTTIKTFEATKDVSAYEWADGWAYAAADKGRYTIEKLSGEQA